MTYTNSAPLTVWSFLNVLEYFPQDNYCLLKKENISKVRHSIGARSIKNHKKTNNVTYEHLRLSRISLLQNKKEALLLIYFYLWLRRYIPISLKYAPQNMFSNK